MADLYLRVDKKTQSTRKNQKVAPPVWKNCRRLISSSRQFLAPIPTIELAKPCAFVTEKSFMAQFRGKEADEIAKILYKKRKLGVDPFPKELPPITVLDGLSEDMKILQRHPHFQTLKVMRSFMLRDTEDGDPLITPYTGKHVPPPAARPDLDIWYQRVNLLSNIDSDKWTSEVKDSISHQKSHDIRLMFSDCKDPSAMFWLVSVIDIENLKTMLLDPQLWMTRIGNHINVPYPFLKRGEKYQDRKSTSMKKVAPRKDTKVYTQMVNESGTLLASIINRLLGTKYPMSLSISQQHWTKVSLNDEDRFWMIHLDCFLSAIVTLDIPEFADKVRMLDPSCTSCQRFEFDKEAMLKVVQQFKVPISLKRSMNAALRLSSVKSGYEFIAMTLAPYYAIASNERVSTKLRKQ